MKTPNTNSFITKNIHLVDPTQKWDAPAEIIIENGIVKKVSKPGENANYKGEVFDAQGLMCTPGLVDVHVHLREPGAEYKETIETGTLAAVAGGVTSVCCMANTKPVNDNPYVTQFIMSQAKQYAKARVFPIGALSKELKGESLAEIGKMYEAGIVGVSDDGITVMNSYLMRKALDYCKTFDLPIISHAEDLHLVGQGVMNEGVHSNCLGLRGIPNEAEEIIVARDIALARLTKGRVHFAHISTWQALEHIRKAKKEGLKITTEVSPHHLMFTDKDVQSYDSNFKMAPPLRSEKDIEALKEALRDGTIDCIATDHAPHAPRDKEVLFEYAANGVVGLESLFSVGIKMVDQKVISMSRMIELMSSSPSNIFKLGVGTLKEGSKADFMLADPKKEFEFNSKELHSKSKNSPFHKMKMKGIVFATFVEGVCKYEH